MHYGDVYFNSLPNDQYLDQSKLKSLPGDKINVNGKLKFVLRRTENIVGKGENAGHRHFLWPTMFSKGFFFKVVKSRNCVVKSLKVALQILRQKFYKSTKISFLYSQSLLIFVHKTPEVENRPTTEEIRELLRPRSTPSGIKVYFDMSSSLIYILEINRRKFQTYRLMNTLWKIITCLLCYGI